MSEEEYVELTIKAEIKAEKEAQKAEEVESEKPEEEPEEKPKDAHSENKCNVVECTEPIEWLHFKHNKLVGYLCETHFHQPEHDIPNTNMVYRRPDSTRGKKISRKGLK